MNAKLTILSLVSCGVLIPASAKVVDWDGGSNGIAWIWEAAGWVGDELPGEDDTAHFVDIAIFKNRYVSGKTQSISDNGTAVTVDKLWFSDIYGVVVRNNTAFYLNGVHADDMTPREDVGVATNQIAGHVWARGSAFECDIGSNHVVNLNATFHGADGGTFVKKTGAGELIYSASALENTGAVWVAEGKLYRTGSGYPALKGAVKVGGAGHRAELVLGPATHATLLPATCDLEVLTNGIVRYEQPRSSTGTSYHEWLKIDHGVYDAGGNGFYQYNQAATERAPFYSFCGATMTNVDGVTITDATAWEVLPAEIPTVFYGTLNMGVPFNLPIPDGDARVDFLVSGQFNNSNRLFTKKGPGTMMVTVGPDAMVWGRVAGRDFFVDEGEFYFNSDGTGIGLGTNNVVVAAGAVFGGSGNIVGVTNFYSNVWRGYAGNLTFNGAEGNPAVFAPGHPDAETGEFVPGTFTVGDLDIVTNNVTFAMCGELRIAVRDSAFSKLVVNGKFTMSGNDVLALTGPTDPKYFPKEETVIVESSDTIDSTFASVTYNGVSLANSVAKGLKVHYTDKTVSVRFPRRGLSTFIR